MKEVSQYRGNSNALKDHLDVLYRFLRIEGPFGQQPKGEEH